MTNGKFSKEDEWLNEVFEEEEIQLLEEYKADRPYSFKKRLAHGVFIAEEKEDYMCLIGKCGLYSITYDKIKRVWNAKCTFGTDRESMEKPYNTLLEAVDGVCSIDLQEYAAAHR